MRTWNLSRPSDIVDQVAEKFSCPKAVGRAPANSAQKPSFVRAMATFATLAVSISIGAGTVNSETTIVPNRVFAIAHSIQEQPPPLDAVFKDRFDNEWTRDEEEVLLRQIADADYPPRGDDLDARVGFVFHNQQESMSLDVPRLSLSKVADIFREKKR